MGKVDFLHLYPLSFKEFIIAAVGRRFADLLDRQDYPMITSFKQTYIDALKQYYFVGGMPEVVQSFIEKRILTRFVKFKKEYWRLMNRIFPSMLPLKLFRKSA